MTSDMWCVVVPVDMGDSVPIAAERIIVEWLGSPTVNGLDGKETLWRSEISDWRTKVSDEAVSAKAALAWL
jgi:hypothetical protein